MSKSSTGMPERVAAFLCYFLGWITGLIFLLIEKRSRYVRRHAILSIIVFGAISVASIVISLIPTIGAVIAWIISIAIWPVWLLLMILAGVGVIYGKELNTTES